MVGWIGWRLKREVGEEERAARTVNVRTRDNHVHGQHSLDEVEAVMRRERDTRSLVGLFGGEAAPAAADGGAAPAAAAEGQ